MVKTLRVIQDELTISPAMVIPLRVFKYLMVALRAPCSPSDACIADQCNFAPKNLKKTAYTGFQVRVIEKGWSRELQSCLLINS